VRQHGDTAVAAKVGALWAGAASAEHGEVSVAVVVFVGRVDGAGNCAGVGRTVFHSSSLYCRISEWIRAAQRPGYWFQRPGEFGGDRPHTAVGQRGDARSDGRECAAGPEVSRSGANVFRRPDVD